MGLDGRVYVVAGGAGMAGEAVAAALLRHGATVAVTSRSEVRLKAVREVLDSPRLHGFVQEGGPGGADAVRDEILAALGPVDGVVAALGGWWEGPPLTALDPQTWQRILTDNLTSHFLAARAYLPVLAGRPDAVYVMLGGIAAAWAIPTAGPISITGAAQTAMLRVLDAQGTGVRLHEVRIMVPIATRHVDPAAVGPEWLTGEQVGEYVARVVAPDFPDPHRRLLRIPESFLPGPYWPSA